jgi:hypothetical protein
LLLLLLAAPVVSWHPLLLKGRVRNRYERCEMTRPFFSFSVTLLYAAVLAGITHATVYNVNPTSNWVSTLASLSVSHALGTI